MCCWQAFALSLSLSSSPSGAVCSSRLVRVVRDVGRHRVGCYPRGRLPAYLRIERQFKNNETLTRCLSHSVSKYCFLIFLLSWMSWCSCGRHPRASCYRVVKVFPRVGLQVLHVHSAPAQNQNLWPQKRSFIHGRPPNLLLASGAPLDWNVRRAPPAAATRPKSPPPNSLFPLSSGPPYANPLPRLFLTTGVWSRLPGTASRGLSQASPPTGSVFCCQRFLTENSVHFVPNSSCAGLNCAQCFFLIRRRFATGSLHPLMSSSLCAPPCISVLLVWLKRGVGSDLSQNGYGHYISLSSSSCSSANSTSSSSSSS